MKIILPIHVLTLKDNKATLRTNLVGPTWDVIVYIDMAELNIKHCLPAPGR